MNETLRCLNTVSVEGGRAETQQQVNHLCPLSLPPISHSPDEVRAVAAEGGLLEEARDELVVLHLVHILLAEGSLPGEAARALRYLSVAAGVSHLNEEAATVREERGVRGAARERERRTSRRAGASSSSPPRCAPLCRSCCRWMVGVRPVRAIAAAAAAASSGGSPCRAPASLF